MENEKKTKAGEPAQNKAERMETPEEQAARLRKDHGDKKPGGGFGAGCLEPKKDEPEKDEV